MANSETAHGLSELPREIMQHILSLLETDDAIRASSVSKAWLNAWQTRSILQFVEGDYYKQILPSRLKFLNYVNRSIQIYREQMVGIENFYLELQVWDNSLVHEWIKVAVENGVKKLQLVCYSSTFALPTIIFEAKSLRELSLAGSRLEIPVSINCHNLRSLRLHCLHLEESKLQSIISNCQMIEDMELCYCTGIDNLKLTIVPKLKQFLFRHEYDIRVQVEAPSLESFVCQERWCWLSLSTSQNLKQLELLGVRIIDEFFLDFKYKFPQLENLKILDCLDVQRISLSSASLKQMLLSVSQVFPVEELLIDAPSMTKFEYDGGFLIPKVSFKTAPSQCCSHISIESGFPGEAWWSISLNEFLKSFTQSKIYLSLSIWTSGSGNIILNMEETMVPSLPFDVLEVHELTIKRYLKFDDLSIDKYASEAILDGIFQACRPKTIRQSFSYGYECIAFIIFKKLIVRKNQNYYDSRRIKSWSWEPRLKEVKVQNYAGSQNKMKPCTLDWVTFLNIKGTKESVLELEWETW